MKKGERLLDMPYIPMPTLREDDPAWKALKRECGHRTNEARGALCGVYQMLNLCGFTDGYTHSDCATIAQWAGRKGFAEAMINAGMAELDENGNVHILYGEEHIGRKTKRRKGNRESQARSRACQRDALKEIEGDREEKEMGKEKAHTPDSDEEGFQVWSAALTKSHPALKDCASLPKRIQDAARAAFRNYPKAADHAPLLAAYFTDRLQEDSSGAKFWRPDGAEQFFKCLGDLIGHAQRWDKETKWSRKRNQLATPTTTAQNTDTENHTPATEEERQAFFDDLKDHLQ